MKHLRKVKMRCRNKLVAVATSSYSPPEENDRKKGGGESANFGLGRRERGVQTE
jgi:hypothetical protein